MTKQTIIQLSGYGEKKDTGELTDSTLYEIIAETEQEAVEIAKKLYPKPNYSLRAWVETFRQEDAPRYTVFFVSCYERLDPVQGVFYDHTAVQVLADNHEEALEKAKKIVTKPFYKITDILQK